MRKKLFKGFVVSFLIFQMIVVSVILGLFFLNKRKRIEELKKNAYQNTLMLKEYFKEIDVIRENINIIHTRALRELIKMIDKDKKYDLDKIANNVGVDYIFLIDENFNVYDSNFKEDIGYNIADFGGKSLIDKIKKAKENKSILHLKLLASTLTGKNKIYSYIFSPKGFYIEVATDFFKYVEKKYSKGYSDYLSSGFFRKIPAGIVTEMEIFFHNVGDIYWGSLYNKRLSTDIVKSLESKERMFVEEKNFFTMYEKVYINPDYHIIVANRADFSYYVSLSRNIFFGIIILSTVFVFIFYLFYIRTSSRYIKRLEGSISLIESLSDKSIEKESYKDEIDYINSVINKVKENIEKREKELIETNKNLEEALAIKTAFLANANHELRTPLTGILGMLYILSQSGLSKEQMEYVNIIEESAHNLYNIIKNILTFSKIKTGGIKPEAKEISIKDFFDEATYKYRQEAIKRGFFFDIEIKTDKDIIFTYPVEIKEILIHLLSNAIKFTKEGGIKVIVSTENYNNRFLTVKVTDTGIGIPKNKINFILKEFTQADLRDTRKYGGLGLGLSIVKEMVSFLGGYIVIDSDEKGTSVMFKVPYFIKEKKEVIQNIGNDKSINIIVTTKDQITRSLLISFFNKEGINYIITEDPNEILIYLSQIEVDFIIVDSDVLRDYKGDIIVDIKKRIKDVKIILITDFYNEKLSDILYIRGIYKTMKKPLNTELLSEIIKKVGN